MIDDSLGMSMAAIGIYNHFDAFNAAVIFGKLAKMCYQFFLEGLMF